MTRDEKKALIKQFCNEIIKWLDKKPTGMLKVEIHARQGGIGDVFLSIKDKIYKKITRNQ